MEGNEAIGWGDVAAGCNFFAVYPFTPATTIYNTMLKLLPSKGGVCLQGEDEIDSIGFCLCASMSGMKTRKGVKSTFDLSLLSMLSHRKQKGQFQTPTKLIRRAVRQ